MNEPIIIGIAGGTGSGKTTLINQIKSDFGDEIVTLSHDYYYRRVEDKSFEQREKLNYDHPNAFETSLMIEHIEAMKKGKSIMRPMYNFVEHQRMSDLIEVKPTKVIIVEGILIFENKDLLNTFDIKVFVDTDADVRLIRRILRDVKERGRSMESVINQYLTTVKLMHEEFVEPSKRNADIIIPEGGFNTVALSMLKDRIRSLLNDK